MRYATSKPSISFVTYLAALGILAVSCKPQEGGSSRATKPAGANGSKANDPKTNGTPEGGGAPAAQSYPWMKDMKFKLSSEDYNPSGKVRELQKNDAIGALEYASSVNDVDPDQEDNQCFNNIVDKTPATVTSNTINFQVDNLEIGPCYFTRDGDSGSFKVSLQFSVACENGLAITSKNIAFTKIEELSRKKSLCKDGMIAMVQLTATKLNGKFSGKDFEQDTRNVLSTTQGTPCIGKVSKGTIINSNCQEMELRNTIKDETSSDPSMGLTIYRFVSENITTAKGGGEWYESGDFQFNINGWEGTVTYSSATKPPKYTIKKGKESASGIIGSSNLGENDESSSSDDSDKGFSLRQGNPSAPHPQLIPNFFH